MNATQIAELRERLIKERERIVAEWENHGGDGGPIDDWNGRDVEERAVQIASEVVERRIALDDSNLLRKVDFALKRIAEGTYEQCENCGATIPLGRLMAKPSVSLCLACQEAKDAGRL
ncbi:MAG: TraR/DksA family transcriptional regulator [Akkermansiaceae bacterium]|jgi:DnaK suppressor protein|nr:TraR/DksA family transcriptional regulator [Akkermansiaceae bacterium]MCU0778104.1 TraR/DksA family transcriptional regulator [Akkermansiaceae bacterium]